MERMKSERAEKQQKKKAGEIEQRSERQRQKKRKEGRDRGKRTQKRRQDKQVQRNNTNERNTMQIQRALYWKLRKKERRPIKTRRINRGRSSSTMGSTPRLVGLKLAFWAMASEVELGGI